MAAYESQALNLFKATQMRALRELPYQPIYLDDLLAASQAALEYVQNPSEIIEGYNKLAQFVDTAVGQFGECVGGFVQGLPEAMVPHAISSGNLGALVNREIVRFQTEQLGTMEAATTSDHALLVNRTGQWICSPCMQYQVFNPGEEPDLDYLNTCKTCPADQHPDLKPRDVKYGLGDKDVILVTRGTMPADHRMRLWELARDTFGFSPIYENLDAVIKGQREAIDIWLFDEGEVYTKWRLMNQADDWYNIVAHPYDLFRYGMPSVTPDYKGDTPFATDVVLQYQVRGEPDFVSASNLYSQALFSRSEFEQELQLLLTGQAPGEYELRNYWQTQPMWPEHYGRIFLSGEPNNPFHPLLAERIRTFQQMDAGSFQPDRPPAVPPVG